MKAREWIAIEIKRPNEEYENVCDEIIIEDFLNSPKEFEIRLGFKFEEQAERLAAALEHANGETMNKISDEELEFLIQLAEKKINKQIDEPWFELNPTPARSILKELQQFRAAWPKVKSKLEAITRAPFDEKCSCDMSTNWACAPCGVNSLAHESINILDGITAEGTDK